MALQLRAQERPVPVSVLTRRIQQAIEGFGPLLVSGELSQARVHGSGHFYATLKDKDATMSVVMWRSAVARHGALPREGERVLVRGSLSLYPPRGQYQLVASRIQAQGQGDLAARFEALKQRLQSEGLFDEAGKRELPFLPRAIGVATAAGSAAWADIQESLRRRFPRMPIVLAPCAVQGPQAVSQIAGALARLDAHPEVDVIICGRGGGSLEDLWAFNEEVVVRAIAACRTPVVSAVGHESDVSLADFAADLRAKTPTMAAELVLPQLDELEQRLADLRTELDEGIDGLVTWWRERLEALRRHRALAGPGHVLVMRHRRVQELRQRLDLAVGRTGQLARWQMQRLREALAARAPQRRAQEARRRLGRLCGELPVAMTRRHHRSREALATLAARLHALSPLAVLGRGYALIQDDSGRVVRRVAELRAEDTVHARLVDGALRARILAVEPLPEETDHG